MIKCEMSNVEMIGPDFLIGAELCALIEALAKLDDEIAMNVIKCTLECASYAGSIDKLLRFLELMDKVANDNNA